MTMLLDAHHVAVSYADRPALRGVDVSLHAGEIVALLGPNGSGKSSLIQSLFGHLAATGEIEWFGKALAKWNRRELARKVAYLPQSPVYEPDQRVVDVLRLGRSPFWSAFGLESAGDQHVVEATADQLGLTDLLARPMAELSGGQRQRVFVGRCLVQEPAALLLDEPNTYLDLKYQIELCQLLRQLAKSHSLGVMMALHDLNLASLFADRITLLQEGKVRATAPINDLPTDLLSSVYGVPLRRILIDDTSRVFVPLLESAK